MPTGNALSFRIPCSVAPFLPSIRMNGLEAKSIKYRETCKVKSQIETRQVRKNCSQQLEHKQVPKKGTEPDVRKGERSLLA